MAVQPITSLGPTDTSLFNQKRPDEMGKEDFLKLLITQLEQQDPLNPQDPSEFTSQLTEFNNLEQLMNLNTSMNALMNLQNSSNSTQALTLIGKEVTYLGNDTALSADGGEGSLQFDLNGTAASATVNIFDSNGKLVKTVEVDGPTAGINTVSWGGEDNNGNMLAAGDYTFTVEAQDGNGNVLEAQPLTNGLVNGLSFDDGVTYLNVGEDDTITLSHIYEVRQPTT